MPSNSKGRLQSRGGFRTIRNSKGLRPTNLRRRSSRAWIAAALRVRRCNPSRAASARSAHQHMIGSLKSCHALKMLTRATIMAASTPAMPQASKGLPGLAHQRDRPKTRSQPPSVRSWPTAVGQVGETLRTDGGSGIRAACVSAENLDLGISFVEGARRARFSNGPQFSPSYSKLPVLGRRVLPNDKKAPIRGPFPLRNHDELTNRACQESR